MQADRKADGARHEVGYRSLAQSVVGQAVEDYKLLTNAGYISYGRVTVESPISYRLPRKVAEMKHWKDARDLLEWMRRPDGLTYSMQWWLDAGGVTTVNARTIRDHLFSQGFFEGMRPYELD